MEWTEEIELEDSVLVIPSDTTMLVGSLFVIGVFITSIVLVVL